MSPPWMPLYVSDYLGDTQHLRALESGAYLHLIMHYWQHRSLPHDDASLAAVARMTDREWKKSRDKLAAFFGPEWGSHKRVDKELDHALEVSGKRREAAEAKHSKSNAIASANGHAIARQMKVQTGMQSGDFAPPPTRDARVRPQPPLQPQSKSDPSLESNNSQQQQPYDPAAAAASKSDFSDEKRRCEEAANTKYPGFGVIEGLIEEGFDFERRILPIIRDLAEKARGPCRDPIHAWAYFAKAIRDTGQVVRRSPEEANRPSEQLLFFEENSREFAALTTGPKGSFYSSVVTKNPDTGKRGVYCRREAAPPPADGRVA